MRWQAETMGEHLDRKAKWHKWFAWHPVFVPRVGMVWLETVERSGKACWSMVDGFDGFRYEYRILSDEAQA